MIVSTTPTTTVIAGSNDEKTHEFTIDKKSFVPLMRTLSEGLYSNPIKTVLTEYVQNAIDSHKKAGVTDKKIKVHIPSEAEPYYSVEDFGTGMSHEFVTNKLNSFGFSNKSDTNDFIGGFGLGFKSFAAYTKFMYLTSFYEGTETVYIVNSDKGVGGIKKLSSQPTQRECNGVIVKIPVSTKDINRFNQFVVLDKSCSNGANDCNLIYDELYDKLEIVNIEDDKKYYFSDLNNIINQEDFKVANNYDSYYSKFIFYSNHIKIEVKELHAVIDELENFLSTKGSQYLKPEVLGDLKFFLHKSNLEKLYERFRFSVSFPVEFELSVNRESFIKTDRFYVHLLGKIHEFLNFAKAESDILKKEISEVKTLREYLDLYVRKIKNSVCYVIPTMENIIKTLATKKLRDELYIDLNSSYKDVFKVSSFRYYLNNFFVDLTRADENPSRILYDTINGCRYAYIYVKEDANTHSESKKEVSYHLPTKVFIGSERCLKRRSCYYSSVINPYLHEKVKECNSYIGVVLSNVKQAPAIIDDVIKACKWLFKTDDVEVIIPIKKIKASSNNSSDKKSESKFLNAKVFRNLTPSYIYSGTRIESFINKLGNSHCHFYCAMPGFDGTKNADEKEVINKKLKKIKNIASKITAERNCITDGNIVNSSIALVCEYTAKRIDNFKKNHPDKASFIMNIDEFIEKISKVSKLVLSPLKSNYVNVLQFIVSSLYRNVEPDPLRSELTIFDSNILVDRIYNRYDYGFKASHKNVLWDTMSKFFTKKTLDIVEKLKEAQEEVHHSNQNDGSPKSDMCVLLSDRKVGRFFEQIMEVAMSESSPSISKRIKDVLCPFDNSKKETLEKFNFLNILYKYSTERNIVSGSPLLSLKFIDNNIKLKN